MPPVPTNRFICPGRGRMPAVVLAGLLGLALSLLAPALPVEASAPAVTKIFPDNGPLAGGTAVTITGLNFTGITVVKFGQVKALSFRVSSSTSITAVAPPGLAAGPVDLVVSGPQGSGILPLAYIYTVQVQATTLPATKTAPPGNPTTTATTSPYLTPDKTANPSPAVSPALTTVASIATQPASTSPATTATGATAAITVATASVTTGAPLATTSPAITSTVSPMSTSPARTTTPGPLPAATFTPASPAITTATAARPVTTTIMISTAAAGSVTQAGPASTPAGKVTSKPDAPASPSPSPSLAAVTPASTAAIPGQVTSTLKAGSNKAVPSATALATPAPATTIANSPAPTTTIANSPAPTTTLASSPVPAASMAIAPLAIAPATVTPATPVTVTTAIQMNAPRLASVSPGHGSPAGGETVVLSGDNLDSVTAVKFGKVPVTTYTINSPTRITAVVPAGPAGVVPVSVSGPGGTAALNEGYVYTGSLTIVEPPTNLSYSGTLTGQLLRLNSSFSLTVSDTTGSQAGWHLLASMGPLTAAKGKKIEARYHTIEGVRLASVSGVVPVIATSYPLAFPVEPGKIFSAAPGSGAGVTRLTFLTQLKVPPNATLGTYNEVLHLTVVSGP